MFLLLEPGVAVPPSDLFYEVDGALGVEREEGFAFFPRRELGLADVAGGRALLRNPASVRRLEAVMDGDGLELGWVAHDQAWG